jgi:hypothetical protein
VSIWSIIFPTLASFAGAWLASKFALNSFYKQKVWERKAEAYTAIFSAISEMNHWFDVHQNVYETNDEISEEEKEELWTSFKSARTDLRKRLGKEVWLIPEPCRARIDKMLMVIDDREPPDWFQMLDTNNGETADCILDLRELVRLDLELEKVSLFTKATARAAKYFSPPSKEIKHPLSELID